jgi:hypothetical protein
MPTFDTPEDAENALTRMLLEAVPENELGNKTLSHLGKLMKLNRWSIRKWINNKKISPQRVMQVVEISKIVGYSADGTPILGDARVRKEDFDVFVYTA